MKFLKENSFSSWSKVVAIALIGATVFLGFQIRNLQFDYDFEKFFPAEASGGVPALQSIGGPLPQVAFCPTGGIGAVNAPAYLALSNTVCVGGSWVAPKSLVEKRDWQAIEALARQAAQLLD